jgi:predicted chitinase
MLTDIQLRRIMPNLPPAKLVQYLPHLNRAMQSCGVDTLLRTAAFIAQLAHESAEFRFMEEIWGPIPAQLRYEPPSDLAAKLGNTQPGDGKRFKGRGPIQITGRYNYQKYGDLLGADLIGNPALAAAAEVAFATAGLFWKTNGLNELADAQQFVAITKRINGGTNGLPDRQMYYERAKGVLADGFVAQAPGETRAAAPRALPTGGETLQRGYEAIYQDAAKAHVKAVRRTAAKAVTAKKPAAKVAPAKAKKVSAAAGVKKATVKKAAAKRAAGKSTKAGMKKAPKKAAKKAPKQTARKA